MTLPTLKETSVFASRYRIVRCIAHGGMGAVYEAIHLETERPCAIKVLLPDLIPNDDMKDRFRRESRVTATIRSEFIVDIFDAGIDEATKMPFLVMELLHGEELGKRLKRVRRLPPDEVVTYLHQAALALDKAHKASIIHRDLKPANLFLTERDDGSPRIKLVDFGIAKLIADGETNVGTTQTLGTPLYMAPEQFTLGERVSPATDIYALGMMAFTLLVGVAYWSQESKAGVNAYAFIGIAVNGPQEPASVRALRRGVELPSAFDAWFAKATARLPADRFETATQAVARLAEALGSALPSMRSSMLPVRGQSEQALASTQLTPLTLHTSVTMDPASTTGAPSKPATDPGPPGSLPPTPPVNAAAPGAHTLTPAATSVGRPASSSSTRKAAVGVGISVAIVIGGFAAFAMFKAPRAPEGATTEAAGHASGSAESGRPAPPPSAEEIAKPPTPAPSASVAPQDAASSEPAKPSGSAAESRPGRKTTRTKPTVAAPPKGTGALPPPVYSRN